MQLLFSSVSTTMFSRAYMQKAWKERASLRDYERNGFAIYFYLTVCSHVEACMAELIERRLMYTRSVIQQFREGNFSWRDHAESFPTLPIYDTLKSLVHSFDRKTDKASLDGLSELFQDVFSVKMTDILGNAHEDLRALASLRNIFAHGRDISFRFNRDEENMMSLDKNPLQLPANRLLAAGIVSTLQVDAREHRDFQKVFFSDEALLYFLQRAKDIESLLKSVPKFIPEKELALMVSLPDLAV